MRLTDRREKEMEDFEEIYRTYFTAVWRYTLKLTHNESLAEEITAETFFRAMQALSSFRQQSSLQSWLCAIARNIWLDQVRRNRKFTDISDTGMMRIPDPVNTPEQTRRRQQVQEVLEAAGKLREPYRTVFLLRYVDSQSFKEIASRYGKSENWACVTAHRAKEMVRKETEQDEE
jgi:RNA polymerase sigma-70 factor (ECF subfamily)